jgi:CubicO group peptidase (beta-lactamase class C family)
MLGGMEARLDRTMGEIRRGIDERLHLGAQVYVSRHGTVVADVAVGESRPGVTLASSDLMLWLSATKPVAAVAIAQLWERDLLALDDEVSRHVPEFAARGKERVTIRHLLTHTGGFRGAATSWGGASWEEIVGRICQSPLEPGWEPGRNAGYHISSSWFMLAEIVRRVEGRPFDQHVREAIYLPLGMRGSWVGIPEDVFHGYGHRIAPTYDTQKGEWDESFAGNGAAANTIPRPGANGRGPVRELGMFYEALLAGGRRGDVIILRPQTVEALTARHRVGTYDQTFRHVMDWGLGFIPNNAHHGDAPYGYGPHASTRAVGHGGSQSSVAFADPEYGLVVAIAFNGMPGEARHHARMKTVLTALYEDLGLSRAPR